MATHCAVGAALWLVLGLTYPAAIAENAAAATGSCDPNFGSCAATANPAAEWKFVAIADLDKKSALKTSKKPAFHSLLQHAILRRSADGVYSVDFGEMTRLVTAYGEAGRGAEFSELAWHRGKLLTFDDRSGIVFEVPQEAYAGGAPTNADIGVLPRYIVLEGDASVAKGQKIEWATVKDGVLHIGSFAKEWTSGDGQTVLHNRTLWVATIDAEGRLAHMDWEPQFAAIRHALGAGRPGYIILEALEWCSERREWFALPRRVSKLPYEEEADETRGANMVVVADEAFNAVRTFEVGTLISERGFSSFKFVPGTACDIVVALKTEECEAKGTQASYVSVLNLLDGKVLLPDMQLPHASKFEGLAIIPTDVLRKE